MDPPKDFGEPSEVELKGLRDKMVSGFDLLGEDQQGCTGRD